MRKPVFELYCQLMARLNDLKGRWQASPVQANLVFALTEPAHCKLLS